MQEFERRGTGAAKALVLHGYETNVTDGGRCDRCGRRLTDAYIVSHTGEQATHRICGGCWSWAREAYGLEEK